MLQTSTVPSIFVASVWTSPSEIAVIRSRPMTCAGANPTLLLPSQAQTLPSSRSATEWPSPSPMAMKRPLSATWLGVWDADEPHSQTLPSAANASE